MYQRQRERALLVLASSFVVSGALATTPATPPERGAAPTAPELAKPLASWVLPAGQEAVVSAFLAIPGLPKPASISISEGRIEATFEGGRVLWVDHPSVSATGEVVLKTPTVLVRVGAGAWSKELLAGAATHLKTAPPPRWRAPAKRAAPPQRPVADRAHERQVDDLMRQATEALSIDEKEKALRMLQAARRDHRLGARRQVRLGALLRKAGDAAGGDKLLREATATLAAEAKADPSARPDWSAALVYLDAAAATAAASAALNVAEPLKPCAWARVAHALHAIGDQAGATRIANLVLEKAPKCERAWLAAALAADRGADGWRAVLKVTDAALKVLPESLPLLNIKAGAHHGGWQNREAAAAWEKIARKDLHFPLVMGMLATAWTQLPELHDAHFLDPMLARLKRDPDDVITRYIVGTASYYRGDYEGVIRYLDPLRAVVPREPRVHLYTAMAHFHLGHAQIAEQRLAALEKFGHSDPDYYYCRSVMRRHTDFEGSLRDLETFVRLSEHRQNSPAKVFKMHRELEVMRSGRVPNAFDLLPDWLRWTIIAAGIGLLSLIAGLLIRKRRA